MVAGGSGRASWRGAVAWRCGATALAGWLGAACGTPERPAEPAVRTFTLPAPELRQPVFEPHLSLDPSRPDRIVVAAHYGIGYNRGGRRIWSWRTEDGGHAWIGAEVPLPDTAAALAADAVTAYGADGTAYLAFLFADTTGKSFDGGAALATMPRSASGFDSARVVVTGGLNRIGAAVDKDWIAVDRGPASPRRGTIYLSWHLNQPDLARGTVASTYWLASSTDGGASFGAPVRVATGFSGQVAVRDDGTVDAIFGSPESDRILHVRSADGGRTFSAPDTVVSLGVRRSFDVPTLVAGAGDTLFVCWSERKAVDSLRYDARCSRSSDGRRWEPPVALVPDLPVEGTLGFPAAAVSRDGLWVMAYRVDADTTRVLLFHSGDGGRSFAVRHQLAMRPFGAQAFCAAADAPCRRAESGVFFPGDYFGLAAAPGRVAAAYVLPEGDSVTGRPTVYVSLIRP